MYFFYSQLPESALAFTRTPNDPTYAVKGSNASLVWEYSVDDRQKELQGIIWSVNDKGTGNPIFLVLENKSGDKSYAAGIPVAYKGRVSIEPQATLVIQGVTLDDNNVFTCNVKAEAVPGALSIVNAVQLIVTGMFVSITCCV